MDIKTLGGAGFASQRTTEDDRSWDLSTFDGIEIVLNATDSDTMKYTFILKDDVLPPDPQNGREQSTISWEYDFELAQPSASSKSKTTTISILWDKFTPTYRGKECRDVRRLDLAAIKRFSIMIRR